MKKPVYLINIVLGVLLLLLPTKKVRSCGTLDTYDSRRVLSQALSSLGSYKKAAASSFVSQDKLF